MKIKTLFFFLALFPIYIFGQVRISGTIVDKDTQLPIAYANIGIFEKGVGTVCNTQGEFSLVIPNDLKNSPILIKHIGYKDAMFLVKERKEALNQLRIEMEASSIELKEVTIVPREDVYVGYQPGDDRAKGYYKTEGLGLEGGVLIRNTGTIVLKEFKMNILKIPFDSLKFRLNIYSIENNAPFAKLNTRDILFTITSSDLGVFTVSLLNEKIQVTDNFVCTIELVDVFGQKEEGVEFTFSAIIDPKGCIYRKGISLGKWEKIKNYSLCFWLLAQK